MMLSQTKQQQKAHTNISSSRLFPSLLLILRMNPTVSVSDDEASIRHSQAVLDNSIIDPMQFAQVAETKRGTDTIRSLSTQCTRTTQEARERVSSHHCHISSQMSLCMCPPSANQKYSPTKAYEQGLRVAPQWRNTKA